MDKDVLYSCMKCFSRKPWAELAYHLCVNCRDSPAICKCHCKCYACKKCERKRTTHHHHHHRRRFSGGGARAGATAGRGAMRNVPDKETRTKSGGESNKNCTFELAPFVPPPDYYIKQQAEIEALKEKLSNLKKQLVEKDKQLVEKDKQLLEKKKYVTELQAIHYAKEFQTRLEIQEEQYFHDMQVDNLKKKIWKIEAELAAERKKKNK